MGVAGGPELRPTERTTVRPINRIARTKTRLCHHGALDREFLRRCTALPDNRYGCQTEPDRDTGAKSEALDVPVNSSLPRSSGAPAVARTGMLFGSCQYTSATVGTRPR